MRKPADMFDRDREWAQLAGFATDERPGATLGVVSGRRRQGKSFLLEAVCEQAGGFYTRLVCFSGSGFTDELKSAAERGEVDLVGLPDLYGNR